MLAYGGTRANSRSERFEALPEGCELVWCADVERQHGVVVDARFPYVRQLRQEETEGHDISPSVWLNAVRGKPADTEAERTLRTTRSVYSLPLNKGKGEWHMG